MNGESGEKPRKLRISDARASLHNHCDEKIHARDDDEHAQHAQHEQHA